VTQERDKGIGILDSGGGGLSVLRHIHDRLPSEDLLYFADQAHVPYGPRPAAEIIEFSAQITQFLLDEGSKMIVVACNTASAAALHHLRQDYPEVPFIGMEPAVKPGSSQTQEGKIGILATTGTFGSPRYANLMARYAQGVVAYEDPCPGLVQQIEAGQLDGEKTKKILQKALEPMLVAGVDTLVLGCTHYPFVLPLIRQIAGPHVAIIDPAPAVARQVERVLRERHLEQRDSVSGILHAFTTGNADLFQRLSRQLLDLTIPTRAVAWRESRLKPD